MVDRGSEACSISAMALSVMGAPVVPRVGSLRYRLRYPARINFFYQKFEALAMVGLVAMVPVIIASQGPVALVRTYPHRWGPFEVGEVPDDG